MKEFDEEKYRREYKWPTNGSKRYKSIGEFELLGEIGRGAFSRVSKARNKADGQLYAIKKVKLTDS